MFVITGFDLSFTTRVHGFRFLMTPFVTAGAVHDGEVPPERSQPHGRGRCGWNQGTYLTFLLRVFFTTFVNQNEKKHYFYNFIVLLEM